ncbi:hypothetical protein HNP84_004568 [Thermocatellispora tengchongensis]|uniref:Uncharacterized protein n=1 Tax=Thermocatellispora tengchongensis TaxID=1073253 RepID=A0A840P0S3_9ACTN|nr:HGxxPAAW family protein [Thermocatellispora tengchongensis]MBB5134834.1 hypothetical protein [Thermocatellispora tengchongensis]
MAETEHHQQSHGGRASSWLAVTVTLIGFVLGGVALCIGPNWFLFWLGAGIVVLGGVLALVFDIFSDVIIDAPRVIVPPDREVAEAPGQGERDRAEH